MGFKPENKNKRCMKLVNFSHFAVQSTNLTTSCFRSRHSMAVKKGIKGVPEFDGEWEAVFKGAGVLCVPIEEEMEGAEFVLGEALSTDDEVRGEFKGGNNGACLEPDGSAADLEEEEKGDAEVVVAEAVSVDRASTGAHGTLSGTEFEAVSLHMCHQDAQVAPSPSVSCGRACGLPSVEIVVHLVGFGSGFCTVCMGFVLGVVCMEMGHCAWHLMWAHMGGANSCTINSSVVWYAVLKLEKKAIEGWFSDPGRSAHRR